MNETLVFESSFLHNELGSYARIHEMCDILFEEWIFHCEDHWARLGANGFGNGSEGFYVVSGSINGINFTLTVSIALLHQNNKTLNDVICDFINANNNINNNGGDNVIGDLAKNYDGSSNDKTLKVYITETAADIATRWISKATKQQAYSAMAADVCVAWNSATYHPEQVELSIYCSKPLPENTMSLAFELFTGEHIENYVYWVSCFGFSWKENFSLTMVYSHEIKHIWDAKFGTSPIKDKEESANNFMKMILNNMTPWTKVNKHFFKER